MMSSVEQVQVTDHAVLRYMERAMGFNVEEVRTHIAAICAGAVSVRATCLRAEGVRFEIVGNRVVTVAPNGGIPSRTTQRRAFGKIGLRS